MFIETALYMLLRNDADVVALVAGRIFAGVLPQTSRYPAIAYRPSGIRRLIETIDISGGRIANVAESYAIFSAAEGPRNYGEASAVDRAIHLALDRFSGTVIDTSTSPATSLDIETIFASPIAHEYRYNDVLQTHEFLSEFMIHYFDPQIEAESSP